MWGPSLAEALEPAGSLSHTPTQPRLGLHVPQWFGFSHRGRAGAPQPAHEHPPLATSRPIPCPTQRTHATRPGRRNSMVPILSARSSLSPGKRLHHQRSSSSHDARSSQFGVSGRGCATPHLRRLLPSAAHNVKCTLTGKRHAGGANPNPNPNPCRRSWWRRRSRVSATRSHPRCRPSSSPHHRRPAAARRSACGRRTAPTWRCTSTATTSPLCTSCCWCVALSSLLSPAHFVRRDRNVPGWARGRQRMALERRGTTPTLSRRTCFPRYSGCNHVTGD
jgi:hypothetical protein